jgi:hypothetical protein
MLSNITYKEGLHPNVLYMIMTIEKKIAEFESVNLVDLNRQLQAVEQQRQILIANMNQVQGAIKGGKIMIQDELAAADSTMEEYEEQKALFLKELEEADKEQELESETKVLEFVSREGQDNEIAETTNNYAAGSDAG